MIKKIKNFWLMPFGDYQFKKTLEKGLKMLALYGVPYALSLLVTEYPEIASLTVGTLLTMLSNFVKNHPYFKEK